jgi:hypothetical protein
VKDEKFIKTDLPILIFQGIAPKVYFIFIPILPLTEISQYFTAFYSKITELGSKY